MSTPADIARHLDGTCACDSTLNTTEHAQAMFIELKLGGATSKVLRQLEPHLQGRAVGMALISDLGHHVAAVWGGTTETNMEAATNALMTIGSSSMEFERRPNR